MEHLKELPLLQVTAEMLMVSSEKVAHVQLNNPIEHALLILVKSGYSAVPVLDMQYKFQGIVGKNTILNEILGLERFELEKLSSVTVEDVMTSDIPCLRKSDPFLTCLKALMDHTFVCVVNANGYFDGIVTRRAVLKQLNKYIHVNKALFNENVDEK
ncbi:CBS domain-containing protein [Amphibacillus marinus]|uniref:CBS domain-containing protein n=1 Tax=Amphibacillus marinus TaxID=872970 RepID=A0A1H8I9H1_9BACI|nr:cyclic-di-AMP-binding protein CbpB [Amphibacillus marinus]SEN65450.1 CBS domain-containing protein [Amphibacillus marinus]